MKTQIQFLTIALIIFQSYGISQNIRTDCNENTDSPQKLFIFVGEFIDAKRLPAYKNINEGRFSAKYKIIDRVCGSYQGDTIRFDVINLEYDSTFMRSKYLLLILTKDSAENEEFVLWGDLFSSLFKTTSGRWAGSYIGEDQAETITKQSRLKPRKISFAKGSLYETVGMTKEEIDIAYPEPYYRLEKGKAIPVFGYFIPEILQHYKDGFLTQQNIYGTPDTTIASKGSSVVIQDVELEEISPSNYDSIDIAINKALSRDPFNEDNIRELTNNCRARGDLTSCSQFFERLIKQYPDSALAYFLKVKFSDAEDLNDSSRIILLQQALTVDSNYFDAAYELAFFFYYLFQKNPNKHYASNARKWLIKSAEIDKAKKPFLKYPIIQLSDYLGDTTMSLAYQKVRDSTETGLYPNFSDNVRKWYYPIEPFLRTKQRWKSPFEINLMRELISASLMIDRLSEDLKYFNEPMLHPGFKSNIYRLLWLRSFHAPVVICLQEIKGNVTIIWKIPRYNKKHDTYTPPVEGRKKLSMTEWNRFQDLLNTIDYWSMISRDYLSNGADGALWLLEAAVKGQYKVTERSGYIYPKYTKCLLYLLSLTDLKLPKREIY